MKNKQQKSAKDLAFEREKTKLHSIIQKKDEEILELKREVTKYKMAAESWEMAARILESKIGVPIQEILDDIERSKKIEGLLKPFNIIKRFM